MKKIKTSDCVVPKSQLTESTTSINCLPDDCLYLIFSELTFEDIIYIEQVCKRWRHVSLKIWSHMRTVNIVYKKWRTKNHPPTSSLNLGIVLQRGGDHITEIKISGGAGKFNPNKAFVAISKHCKQLQFLEFSYCFGRQEVNLNKIGSAVARNLKGLYFLNNCKINKASLVAFLKKAINLETLWLDSCSNVTNDALLNLSDKCKDLNLRACKLNKQTYSLRLFLRLPELQYLDVSRTNITPGSLTAVSTHLVSLSLRGSATKYFSDGSYKNLCMPNLTTFDLGGNPAVTDEVVSYFHTCFPSLRDLCLEGCENINFDISCRLEECKNIRDLDLSETVITDYDFIHLVTHMNDLEGLVVDCDDLTESGLTMAVSSLPKLKWIFIGETFKLTEKFFQDALKIVKSRTNDAWLEIEIDYLEKNAKKCKKILKDEIARLKLTEEKNRRTRTRRL